MQILDYVITAIWLSPILYFSILVSGKIFHWRRQLTLTKESDEQTKKKVGKIIFQIPTIGNVQTVNKIFETVKNYTLEVPLETWVVIEERDTHKAEYVCDNIIVVPADFDCEDLYKGRALEYARQMRQKMVADGKLESNYLLLQGDDDALPSLEFIKESLIINADISIGTITPRPKGVWNTVLDYERCVACGIFCNFFTNIGKPLWAHGEGTWLNSEVDMAVSYDISPYTHNTKEKLISSEDSFYFHKASLLGFKIFNSEKRIYIMPPITFADAIKQRRRWVWGELQNNKQENAASSEQVKVRVHRLFRSMALFRRNVRITVILFRRRQYTRSAFARYFYFACDLVRNESLCHWKMHGLETGSSWGFSKLPHGNPEFCYPAGRFSKRRSQNF